MTFIPKFPTKLHQDTAELIRDYFLTISSVDTVLVVNSCARGQAVPESYLDNAGPYFQKLQIKWFPYYNNDFRLQRLTMTRNACNYDLDHIPFFINRALYFQAFDILCKAFQEYLQALFIANKTYPIAYNKWIKEQVIKWLNKPDLYPELSPILSISNIESNEINDKVKDLRRLLSKVT